jgi:hypothetical protein
MKQIVLVLGLGLLGATAAFVGCGPVKKLDSTSLKDRCNDYCGAYSQCFETGGSGPSRASVRQDCEEGCSDAVEEAKEDGCEDEIEDLLKCFDEKFTCDLFYGSGEFVCERPAEAYSDCIVSNSGS